MGTSELFLSFHVASVQKNRGSEVGEMEVKDILNEE